MSLMDRYNYRSRHEYEWAYEFGDNVEYEPRSFNVQGESIYGKTYRPDFYHKKHNVWLEIKARKFNDGNSQIVTQLIRANAAVRKYGIRLYLLAGLPSDFDAFLVSGTAFNHEHFRTLGLIRTMYPPNVEVHRAGPSDPSKAGPTIVAGSGESTCWADGIPPDTTKKEDQP